MGATFIETEARYGYDFISGAFIPEGCDEYSIREKQTEALYGRSISSYRHIAPAEIKTLQNNNNLCKNWDDVFVSDEFDPELIRDTFFAGRVHIGRLKAGLLRYHDYTIPAGIYSSRIIACAIGDDCAIMDCRYISHYLIGNNVILSSIKEMETTNHSKFGAGVVKAGEDESVRVSIDPLNESGGRSLYPFYDIISADAYLWSTYRDDTELMAAFKRMTQDTVDSSRGYYGTVGHGSVIKHCLIIKDVNIGDAAYIKGANKLKNLTIKSDKREPTQIGEGVELVNGIIGYGCHVFYGCKAVRFVLGNNCNLKYGARLVHSVLGDNSTISCCEVLNNLVFPAHEQHHNNSFLIAAMVMGQSNMAAGATVGSNHNSRGNDGEIIAGRGFWPGISSALKHNCRFASFVLIAKGSYPAELSIPFPFSLITTDSDGSRREIMPAYWWMHNMYALERNAWKFKDRDKREFKTQYYETEYLAPDTIEEIIKALTILTKWKEEMKRDKNNTKIKTIKQKDRIDYLIGGRFLEKSAQAVRILKPEDAERAYRQMLVFYSVKTLAEYFTGDECPAGHNTFLQFQNVYSEAVSFEWVNLGGQLVRTEKADTLRLRLRQGAITSWEALHHEYAELQKSYSLDKARNALEVLRYLGSTRRLSAEQWNVFIDEALDIRAFIGEQVYKTRLKDYKDPFRMITYRNTAERDAVLGTIDDNKFIKMTARASERFASLAGAVRITQR
jgi:UDP-3-O-[3-hydroxymyristoyl] glucosamine N-acyltransferase